MWQCMYTDLLVKVQRNTFNIDTSFLNSKSYKKIVFAFSLKNTLCTWTFKTILWKFFMPLKSNDLLQYYAIVLILCYSFTIYLCLWFYDLWFVFRRLGVSTKVCQSWAMSSCHWWILPMENLDTFHTETPGSPFYSG